MWVERRASAFDVFNYAILVVMSACFLYPVVMTLALSFSDADQLGNATVGVWPVGYSLNAYRLLLSDDRILRFYLNTINFTVLWRVIMPLSKPLLATFALYTAVMFWNDFFWSLIFLRDQNKQPIQLFLRRILVLLDFATWRTALFLRSCRTSAHAP